MARTAFIPPGCISFARGSHDHRASQRLGEKRCAASFGNIDRLGEAGGGVNASGAVIVLLHFEGQLAATEFAGASFDRVEQATAETAAALPGKDEVVVVLKSRAVAPDCLEMDRRCAPWEGRGIPTLRRPASRDSSHGSANGGVWEGSRPRRGAPRRR